METPQPAWLVALLAVLGVLAPLIPALVLLLRAKAKQMERADQAEAERDTIIEGVEKSGDPVVKAQIKRTSMARKVDLSASVDRVTRKINKRKP